MTRAVTGWVAATVKVPDMRPDREIEALRRQVATMSGYTREWVEIQIVRSGPCAPYVEDIIEMELRWRIRKPWPRGTAR